MLSTTCITRPEIITFKYPSGSFRILFQENKGNIQMGTQQWEITRNGLWNINYHIRHEHEVLAYARYPIHERKGFLNLNDDTELTIVIRRDFSVDFLNRKSEFYARVEPDSNWLPAIQYAEAMPLKHMKCIAVLSVMMYYEIHTDPVVISSCSSDI